MRIEARASSVSLDPREWHVGSLEAAANEKLAALVFERLLSLDDYGRFLPVLATEWTHDGSNRRWQFTIRSGVTFSDGSALAAADVAAALQPLLPANQQVSAFGNTIVIQSAAPVADLLEQLASGRYFIYRALPNGALVGTGPFVFGEPAAGAEQSDGKNPSASRTDRATDTASQASGKHVYFRANTDAWAGRPFVDGIDVTLGVPPLRAMFDLQLGKADLIELSPELVPRARQVNLRVWTSEPLILYGLRFDDAQRIVSDPRLREALSLSLDRESMANVLLQKQAEPAAALLPQWLSGYAFLFSMDANLERSKELRRPLPANEAAASSPLRLRVDSAGDLAKLIGERVALNARQASILVQVMNRPATRSGSATAAEPPAGVHLFAWHFSSLSPRAELDSMFAAYNLSQPSEETATSTNREQLYARERRVLGDWQVLPLVTQAESVGLAPTVRDWMPARWGEWHLADVWLDLPEPVHAGASNAADGAAPSSAQPRSAASGAKP
ncbi:MAG TPA: ABC transporter substrate-binding protein [Candidatus Acidoferrum sp.]|nr:ABC transporter substrate-binding protein [Candidatus Acidoferrum sp.]